MKGHTNAESAHAPEFDAWGRKIYRCGTLTYTKRGLVMLIAWLLWGDFCFTLMETVVPSIIPLKMRSLGASNWIIAVIMTTLPGIFNTTVAPWVSFKSDRYRSRWGRRIPFILCTMPFLVASLLFIGFSDSIGGWLHECFLKGSALTRNMVIIGLLALFVGMFDLFNMFVSSVYWYLFNDVVPNRFLATFISWFRLVGVLSAALYKFFIFQYALSHMTLIYAGAAVLYLLGFGAMCFMVKEGDYPSPSTDGKDPPGVLKDIRVFAKQCYSTRYYWDIFLHTTFVAVAATSGIFAVFYHKSLGLNLSLIGKMGAIHGFVVSSFLVIAGILVDRWHPVRVDAYSTTCLMFVQFFPLVWIFATPPAPMILFWVSVIGGGFTALMAAMHMVSALPRLMDLLPKEKFGQFCGAQALVRSGGVMVGGFLAGVFLDVIKRFYPPGDLFPYRFIHLWQAFFTVLAFYFYYRVYRSWKRLGGEKGYIPPTMAIMEKNLPKSKNAGIAKGLICIPLFAFVGAIGEAVFYLFHFQFSSPNARNVFIFSIYGLLLAGMAFGYLRLIRFMERP